MNALHYQSYVKAKIIFQPQTISKISAFVSALITLYVNFIFLPKMIDHSQTQLIATYLLLLLNVIITIKYKKKIFKRPPST